MNAVIFFYRWREYSRKHPVFTPKWVLLITIGAFVLAVVMNSLTEPQKMYTTIHFTDNVCQKRSDVDLDRLRANFQRIYTEIRVVRDQVTVDKDGCVTGVRFWYEPLPPVMDSLTTGGK